MGIEPIGVCPNALCRILLLLAGRCTSPRWWGQTYTGLTVMDFDRGAVPYLAPTHDATWVPCPDDFRQAAGFVGAEYDR